MRKANVKFFIALCMIAISAIVIPNLGLLVPAAGLGCFIGSTYFGAAAIACGASGPAGWAIFGMCTAWSL